MEVCKMGKSIALSCGFMSNLCAYVEKSNGY